MANITAAKLNEKMNTVFKNLAEIVVVCIKVFFLRHVVEH
jgi:hypothetical protein